jgi:hypothetical protein
MIGRASLNFFFGVFLAREAGTISKIHYVRHHRMPASGRIPS